MRMRTDTKLSYDRSTDSRPQIGQSSADSLHVARQGNAIGRRWADHRATVGRMENFVVGEGNRWGMFLMWQLKSADQNRVCRLINIKKNQVGRLSVLMWLRHNQPPQNTPTHINSYTHYQIKDWKGLYSDLSVERHVIQSDFTLL